MDGTQSSEDSPQSSEDGPQSSEDDLIFLLSPLIELGEQFRRLPAPERSSFLKSQSIEKHRKRCHFLKQREDGSRWRFTAARGMRNIHPEPWSRSWLELLLRAVSMRKTTEAVLGDRRGMLNIHCETQEHSEIADLGSLILFHFSEILFHFTGRGFRCRG